MDKNVQTSMAENAIIYHLLTSSILALCTVFPLFSARALIKKSNLEGGTNLRRSFEGEH